MTLDFTEMRRLIHMCYKKGLLPIRWRWFLLWSQVTEKKRKVKEILYALLYLSEKKTFIGVMQC